MLCGWHIKIWNLSNHMKKQNKKHPNARFIDEKLKTKSLVFFVSFFHVICKISNFNMSTAKHLAQASFTELTLSDFFPVFIRRYFNIWYYTYHYLLCYNFFFFLFHFNTCQILKTFSWAWNAMNYDVLKKLTTFDSLKNVLKESKVVKIVYCTIVNKKSLLDYRTAPTSIG